MYASETWTLTKDNERKLRVFERRSSTQVFWMAAKPIKTIVLSQNKSINIRIIQRSTYCEGEGYKDKKAAMGGACANTA